MSDESLNLMLQVLLGADSVKKFEDGMITIEQALEGVDSKSVELSETFANKLEQGLKGLDDQLAKTKGKLSDFNNAAEKLGKISQTAFIASSAVVGSIYLSAKTEADRIIASGGEVDAVTARWIAANERIQSSQQKIGRAAESAVVPFLEKAAGLAEKAANFVEANPELVSAALKVGLWTAGLSAIGVAVAKGIKLFADFQYLAATAQFMAASEAMKQAAAQNLEAALLMQKGGTPTTIPPTTPVTGGAPNALGKATQTIGTLSVIATSLVIGAEVGALIGNAIAKQIYGKDYKQQGLADAALTFTRIFRLPAELAGETWKKIGFDKLGNLILDTSQKADDFTKELLGLSEATEKEAEAFKILQNLIEDEAKAERKYADDRQDIFTKSARDLEDANRTLDDKLGNISSSLAQNISKINSDLKKTLADLGTSFAEANLQAEQEYQQQRAEIIANGEAEIARIQQQAQKELEDLERDHVKNVQSLTGARDALGLAQENVAYQERQNEIKRNAEESIAQARANTAAQLAEAQSNYEQQRAQRLAEYEKQKAEAQAQAQEAMIAARAKAEEDKKAAEEANKEQKTEIERKRAEALVDLKRQFDNEQRERVLAANNAITALGGALNAEAELRRKYYDIILAEANSFMSSYQSALNASNVSTSAGPAPSRKVGGYTDTGLYNMHRGEFVANPSTTRALESMVGGSLTQENLLGLAGGGSGVVWNDYRRFDGDVSPATRRAIMEDTLGVLNDALKKAKR